MASNVNTVVLVGNLTKAPELRTTSGGTSVANLRLAVNSSERSGGEWTERPSYFDVTVWGNQAQSCEKYLSKGSPVAVHGRLRQERWQGKEGNERSRVVIVATTIQFLSSKSKGSSGSSGGGYKEEEPDTPPPSSVDDDIPFARPPFRPLFGERERKSNRG